MSVIHIRNLADAPQHVEEVSRWLWEQWARADGYSLEDIVYRTRHAMGRRGVPQMLVAEEDGAPVGVVSLWHNDAKTRQDLTPWLAALYIRPDCRGRHIGQQLQAALYRGRPRHRPLMTSSISSRSTSTTMKRPAGFSLNRFPPETARRNACITIPCADSPCLFRRLRVYYDY